MSDPTYTYLNEDAIDEELLCSHICHQPLTDPVVHNGCRNSFCRFCIKNVGWQCPLCRTGTNTDFADVNSLLVLNMLFRLPVKCTNCAITMPRGEFDGHKLKCPILCPHGCGETITRSTLDVHARVCMQKIVPCTSADLGCSVMVPAGQLGEHKKVCQWVLAAPLVSPLINDISNLRHAIKEESAFQKETVQELERKFDRMMLVISDISQEIKLIRTSGQMIADIERDKWNVQERKCKHCHAQFNHELGGCCDHMSLVSLGSRVPAHQTCPACEQAPHQNRGSDINNHIRLQCRCQKYMCTYKSLKGQCVPHVANDGSKKK
jgi:hypothetical protein